MALETSSGGTPCSEGRLTQNSAITVTIDDLTEGLIVVSFTHSDNLYQGVLFQLNRERGIPSGISFAKEHVLGNAPVEKCETDPTQITPLHQRHTYNNNNNNQGTCNGTSHSPISQPSLRRIIKPPARFKNARMSLRLRARPVLCAKCRSLCDDKADNSSSGKDEPPKEDAPTTEKSKKERPKLGKNDTVNTIASIATIDLKGKLRGGHEPPPVVDPQDLCYESVGSTRVVENYWRRPLVQPLIPSTEETYARLRKHKAPSESGRDSRKKPKTANAGNANPTATTTTSSDNNTDNMRNALMNNQEQQALSLKTTGNDNAESDVVSQKSSAHNSIFITKSNDCDNNFPNTRSRKALNLKMCITKIAEMRNGDKNERRSRVKGHGMYSTSTEALTQKRDEISLANPALSSPFNNHSDSSLESTEVMDNNGMTTRQDKTSSDEGSSSSSGLKTRASTKKSKAWENRIRTKSTVPVRFRDESYLTKNIFNFNKRRPAGSTTGGGDIPVLTISRSDDENTFKVSALIDPEGTTDSTVTTSKIEENSEDHDEETAASSVQSSPQHEHSSTDNHNDDDASHHSPSSSSTLTEVPANISIKPSIPKTPELIKTPTIKITFGSSGNGMVVQIPPKVAQHKESPSTTDLKAVKKAMKKAKKEAKRRRSVSPDFSPSSNVFSPDYHTKPERSRPSSPVSRTIESHEESDVSPPHDDKLLLLDYNSSEPSTSTRVSKKKKKQKKRRRNSKLYKENDGFASSSSHEPMMITSMSSPHSNSSSNHDNSCGSQGSPSGTSIKSCNMADSVSHPVAQESVQSLFKDTCPPRRRRSMPATSTTSHSADAPRVCINLKRVDTNHFIPLPLHNFSSHSDNEENSSSHENNGMDTDEAEVNDFPIDNSDSSHVNQADILGETEHSVDYYKDKESENSYRRGDIVWGKLPATPWWPAKIDDIVTGDGEETRAKVSWYKSTTQSCIQFNMLAPFTEYFDSKYARSRRRGLYQHAVKDALVEAHRLNPEDLPTD